MVEKLTERQRLVLEQIRRHQDETGMPPTRAELAREMGFSSVNAAEQHLRALDRKGAIELLPGRSRGIRLGRGGGLPVVGRVAAGSPILAQQHIEEQLTLDAGLFSPAADYLLRVRGESMKDVGILDGDLLAVRKTNQAENGQIVVARIEGEVTVKRFRKQGNKVELLPENADFSPILVDLKKQELVIEGLAVGLLRNGELR